MQQPTETNLRVAGLERPATIRIDAWGIAHIAADSLPDLFLAQGFNAARDRLWQIDLWRKRGLGLLAEDFGPGYLAQDKVARRFLYRGDMRAEWASYADDARMICTQFVGGINAFLDLIDVGAAALPPEFMLMGTRPARWAPEDVVRIRTHGLAQNAASEAARAVLLGRGRDQADRLRHHRHPGFEATPLPPGPADAPPALFDLMKLATAPVSFSRERLAASLAEAGRWIRVTELGIAPVDASDGSNSWAVHGSRTASGRPMLASDPHRALTMPSLRYLVHLTAPGFDAIGAGEPCVPGISLGHNGAIAFGLTIFDADQEDIMVYETDGTDRYRYRGGWERFERVEERIRVKGEADQAVTLAYTRHGPVLLEEPERKRAFALRTVWSEPGAAPYLASLSSMRARELGQFRAALARWKAPAVNMTYAGLDGHVARLTAGYLPLRRDWNGVLPVPGDGRFEWQGNRPMADRPEDRDPPAGFVFTANECNLPADWDHAHDPIGFEWSDEARSLRIREVLPGIARHRLEDSMALQTDQVSVTARRAAAVVASLDRDHPLVRDADAARALLARWDHRLDCDSAAAALYGVWWSRHLKPGLVALTTGDAREAALATPPHNQAVLALLEDASAPLWRQAGGRAAFLGAMLAAAWQDCAARLGPDPAAWRWGDLHQMRFAHPLDAVGADAGWSVGPFPLGGDATTVMNATYRSDFAVSHGAAMRLVIDVGGWDKSRCINAPGQSGVPGAAQHGALAETWAAGGYVPLAYSAPAVAAATRAILRLEPA